MKIVGHLSIYKYGLVDEKESNLFKMTTNTEEVS